MPLEAIRLTNQLTGAEVSVVQDIASGTYFIEGEVPTGNINDSNVTFTLSAAPNPAASLKVYLNGQRFKLTEDYTLSGSTLTMVLAPPSGSILQVDYRVSPV